VTVQPYLRFELLRTFRNRRFVILSLLFPLVLYLLIAGPNRNEHNLAHTGISAPLYFMVGLAAFGTMNAALSAGARIAGERSTGWNRQLRITPLSSRDYIRAKVIGSYLMAIATILVVFAAGIALGVHMPLDRWVRMTALMLIALVPFVALGILVGHLVSFDSIGPVIGGATALFAFLGGSWFPITGNGFIHDVAQDLPSFWLVDASRVGLSGHNDWGSKGWAVVVIWTIVAARLAARAYRRDTSRV
jgi:ABC-2 type transport system permease protein